MVEFALLLPVLLLVLLVGLDFGRIYLGYVNLQNMARIAANFAANNPTASWGSPTDPTVIEYRAQIQNDAKVTNCHLDGPPGPPVFTDRNGDSRTTGIGDLATVNITCKFAIVTPFLSSYIGTNGLIDVSASAAFPIKQGMASNGGGGGTPTLVADFAGTPRTGPEPLVVAFQDRSTGTPTSWAWDFQDDGVVDSTERNPTFTYGFGTYSVSLTVGDGSSSATATKVAYIGAGAAAGAVNFSASPVSGTSPLVVSFADTSTTAATAWAWDFDNDGLVDDTNQDPSHTYSTPGTYSVSLTITTASGPLTKTVTNMINVSAPLCTVPVFVDTSTSTAPSAWAAAGFTTSMTFKQGNLPWTIKSQSITGNSPVDCGSLIRVSSNNQP